MTQRVTIRGSICALAMSQRRGGGKCQLVPVPDRRAPPVQRKRVRSHGGQISLASSDLNDDFTLA